MNSSKYQSLTSNALSLIVAINKAQQDFDKLLEQARTLGINLQQGDNETNTAYLGRIAAEGTEKKHDALKAEELNRITRKVDGDTTNLTPTSWVGRSLNRLANVIG